MTTALVKRAIDQAMKEGGLDTIQQETIAIENLFLEWVTDRSQSVNKLSEKTGMSHKQIKEILGTGEFQRRYLEDTAGFREVAKDYTRARAAEIMDTVVGRLAQIVETGEDRDAIGASRVLVSMIDDDGPKEVAQTYIDARVLQIAGQGITGIDDVKRMMAAQIDGNIGKVSEERASRGRKS